jgi:hypothetical protein
MESCDSIGVSLTAKNRFQNGGFELSGFIKQHHRVKSHTVFEVVPREKFQNLGRRSWKERLATRDHGKPLFIRYIGINEGASIPVSQRLNQIARNVPECSIQAKPLLEQWKPAQTFRFFKCKREVSNFFGLQMILGGYGKTGGGHHYSGNCAYVLYEGNSRTGFTGINRPVVPFGLNNQKWSWLTSLKDTDVDLTPDFSLPAKQPDVVLDLKLRRGPVGPKAFENGFFVFGRCHRGYLHVLKPLVFNAHHFDAFRPDAEL